MRISYAAEAEQKASLLGNLHNSVGSYMYPGAGWLAASSIVPAATDFATPNLFTSAHIGVLQGAPLIHRGGLQFGGMLGYKTLFTGVSGKWSSKLSVGNAVLSATEGIAKIAYRANLKWDTIAALTRAREVGFTGVLGSFTTPMEGPSRSRIAKGYNKAELRDFIRNKTFMKSGSMKQKGNWLYNLSRTLGGQGAQRGTYATMEVAGGRTLHMPKIASGAIKLGGKWAARFGTGLAAYSWFSLISEPIQWMTGNVVARGAEAAIDLKMFMNDQLQFSFGNGYLSDSFRNEAAATERQRAVQAIYAAKINPSSRMFGREAQSYHR